MCGIVGAVGARECTAFLLEVLSRDGVDEALEQGYHVALVKGTDVDKPRNLAKSVTVE